ncbi:uncharacterized protein KQ657_002930 [Scheffersomyces spartinae]|uniref:Bud22 domain-containing protein n=1 Tax=Scheffersomyces spartinae TaxID=45513 RepID=A0A9P7V5C2_9ASCO|nr:uncharacterized protein KQ657_002930 [Scheffersomyces spartinae]KAG7191661.1 hypothetical protein KQ657_002930 [Scheffersomyces spartinae]
MWKVDLLETKYFGYTPRFKHTRKLLRSKKLKKIPETKEQAAPIITELKTQEFEKKYYGAHKKLTAELRKQLKECQNPEVVKKMLDGTLVEKLVCSRIIKIMDKVFDWTETGVVSYVSKELRDIVHDKELESNPLRFFKDHLQNDKAMNKFVSGVFNSKNVKTMMQDIEWLFKQIKGNVSKKDRLERRKLTGEVDSDDDSDDDDKGSEYSELNDMLAGTDDEDEDAVLDPSINYAEVTDDEQSNVSSNDSSGDEDESSDEFFEENEPKRPKHALPALTNGYYSGGSDDEEDNVDNDNVVKELTTQRKNRRGQRARQKIWAQKYGKNAIHVKEQKKQYESERAQRQLEYEERCRKRELKAQLSKESATGANTVDVGTRKERRAAAAASGSSVAPSAPPSVHPSWEAKKLAEEKQKNIKFEGKKIKFDD